MRNLHSSVIVTHSKTKYCFITQEFTGISETSTLASATLSETDTASQTTAAAKAGHLAAKKSNLIGVEEQTDITAELLVPAGEAGKTANVTKVVRKEATQRPVQHMHMQGVNIFITWQTYYSNAVFLNLFMFMKH